MTRKEEREERKRRRELKRIEREKRKMERELRRKKKEMAKGFVNEARKNGMKRNYLPSAPKCEVCGMGVWCIHNFEDAMRRKKGGDEKEEEKELMAEV